MDALEFLLEIHNSTPEQLNTEPSYINRVIRMDLDTEDIKAYINVLINRGADINSQMDHFTPLMYLITRNETDLCKFLVEKGADVNLSPQGDNCALAIAIRYDNADLVRFFLEHGAIPRVNASHMHGNILGYAVFRDAPKCVRTLASLGYPLDDVISQGFTPLLWASSYGHIKVIKALIECGADTNIQGSGGLTTLHIQLTAYWQNTPECINYLLGNGARTDIPATDGKTVMDIISDGHRYKDLIINYYQGSPNNAG